MAKPRKMGRAPVGYLSINLSIEPATLDALDKERRKGTDEEVALSRFVRGIITRRHEAAGLRKELAEWKSRAQLAESLLTGPASSLGRVTPEGARGADPWGRCQGCGELWGEELLTKIKGQEYCSQCAVRAQQEA